MQSTTPNPQTTMVNLTKELHKLLQDPLHKSPSPLPHLTYNTRGLAGPKPNLILNLASFLHNDLLILTETYYYPSLLIPQGICSTHPDSTAGVTVIPVSPKICLHPTLTHSKLCQTSSSVWIGLAILSNSSFNTQTQIICHEALQLCTPHTCRFWTF